MSDQKKVSTKQLYYQKNKAKINAQNKLWRAKERAKNNEMRLESEILTLESMQESLNILTKCVRAMLTSKRGLASYQKLLNQKK